MTDSWWPHRFVLREACDLWSAVPEVRDSWLEVIDETTTKGALAIQREREVGVVPTLGVHGVAIRASQLPLLGEYPRAMTRKQLHEVRVESYRRTVFLADDPDPEGLYSSPLPPIRQLELLHDSTLPAGLQHPGMPPFCT